MKTLKFSFFQIFLLSFFSCQLAQAQIQINADFVSPGACMGTSSNPSWYSGNKKLTSACTDVNVGIGTNFPLYPLHVVGQANADWITTGQIGIGTTSVGNVGLQINSNGPAQFALAHLKQTGVSPYKKMIFMEVEESTAEIIKVVNTKQGFTPFVVDASGRLTISNSTSKILQLQADGMLRARRIKVDTDNWADYVFDEDYKLLPLAEVEKFINTKKHLPNVPSQKEMIENGIDLQEMNVLMMEKIEELTLYIIAQQKEIEELKERTNILENE